MKLYVIALIIALCSAHEAVAQTFLQHVQQSAQGKGKVTVVQSKEIDELVNSADVSGAKPANAAKQQPSVAKTQPATANAARKTADKTHADKPNAGTATTQPNKKETTSAPKEDNISHHETTTHTATRHTTETPTTTETDASAVDMHKKMPARSYKVNGYRVQVYAGGNSRADKTAAQKAGNDVKRAYPELPVYVHFYSPRWICRVGNFRSYEEANVVLARVKKLGYKQACIVSGKITVAY